MTLDSNNAFKSMEVGGNNDKFFKTDAGDEKIKQIAESTCNNIENVPRDNESSSIFEEKEDDIMSVMSTTTTTTTSRSKSPTSKAEKLHRKVRLSKIVNPLFKYKLVCRSLYTMYICIRMYA